MEPKTPELQPRLRLLAELVPTGARLADIGTDHGYLPVSLLLAGRVRSVIASDVGAAPLEHARRTAAEYGLTERIDFRLCDGLRGIAPEDADTILVAGMGGENIAAILEGAPWLGNGRYTLLLQPMSRQEFLRRWLSEHGFPIVSERLVRDKETLYNIFLAAPGACGTLTAAEEFGGVGLAGDPLWAEYLNAQAHRLRRAAAGLRQSKQADAAERADELEALADALIERKGEWLYADGRKA